MPFRSLSRPRAMVLAPLAALAFALSTPGVSLADANLSGAYLASRLATFQNDYAAGVEYYDRLLLSDPTNRVYQEGALVSHVAMGEFDRAAAIANLMVEAPDPSEFAVLVALAADAHAEDFPKGVALLDKGASAGDLVSGIYRAWALAGEGKMADASKAFDTLAKKRDLAGFATYHKALALAMVGDYEGAEALFSGPYEKVLNGTRRAVLAHVEILSRLERNQDAEVLMDRAFGPSLDPELQALKDRLAKGEMLPFTIVTSARDGVAELYLSIGQALSGETPSALALMHARLASWIRPGTGEAALLSAVILEQQKQFPLAIAAYAALPKDSPLYPAAELGRAGALSEDGQPDAAIEVLDQLTRTNPDLASAWIALGDDLRQAERFADAASAYDKAVKLIATPGPRDWFVFFARGIAEDKSGNWAGAEQDMREALKLAPDQPSVLNYLGYSYVEKKENLDEALDMIRKAAAARPGEGYIIDSLGWAYYRLGRYDEAVAAMEKAVGLEPTEPLLNDHLGDVYWAVGRQREAMFQWRRALNLGPGDDLDMDRVRKKLAVGLDQVLKDEGAPPLHPTQNAN